jgi:hypothetical protein
MTATNTAGFAGRLSGMRMVRILWPEIVFGLCWVALLALSHTLFTDDDTWQHTMLDGFQWVVFCGYVAAGAAAHLRQSGQTATN